MITLFGNKIAYLDDDWAHRTKIEDYLTPNHLFALQEMVRYRLEHSHNGSLEDIDNPINELDIQADAKSQLKNILSGSKNEYLQ